MDRIEINVLEDRLAVASILIKNGYTVRSTKTRKTGKKSYSYFLEFEKNEEKDEE